MPQPRSLALHRFDGLLRGVVEVVRRGDVEIGLGDDLLAERDIGALKPHHERHAKPHFLHRGDDAFGDDIAFHDAAENVDQDTLHVRIGRDDLERGRDLLLRRAAADVKEVGLRVPLVVRLEGTNVALGKEIIAKSNLNVTSGDDLDDAAQKIVKAVRGA